MEEFRSQLKTIVETHCSERKKGDELEVLRSEFNHSIRIIDSNESVLKYNCYMFALDFYQKEINSLDIKQYFIDELFIIYLLNNEILKSISEDILEDNDLIIYFVNNNPVHSGKVRSKRIVSKWGSDILCEHMALEVPINYGWSYRYYKYLLKENVRNCFRKYNE